MADRYWVGGTATWDATAGSKWSTTSGGGGGASVPTSADNVYLDANSGAVTITISGTRTCLDLTCTGFTGALNSGLLQLSGSLLFVAGMSTSGIALDSRTGTKNLTFAGKTLSTLTLVTGTHNFQDACICSGYITITNGTTNFNNVNITADRFWIAGASSTRVINCGSSLFTLSGGGSSKAIEVTNVTNLTFNAGTSTFKLTYSGTLATTIEGLGITFYKIWIATGNTTITSIVGSNTYYELFIDGNNRTVKITSGTTQTFIAAGPKITTNGTGITFTSTTAATHTLTSSSGTCSISNVTLSYSIAQGGATWNAFTSNGNVDGGNNTGWGFVALTRYLIATGNYNDPASWSASDGGAGGASVPSTTNDVYLTATSGAVTLTVNVSSAAKSFTCTGFTGTLAGSSALEVKGSLTLAAGMTITYSGDITMTATDSQTMTFAGKEMAIGTDWVFNGTGGTWTLQDAWSVANNSGNITLTAGTLNTNGKTITNCGTFNISGTTARTLTLGASSISIEFQWLATTTTNLTFNANTSVIDVVVGALGIPFAGGGLTYNEVKLRSNGRPNEMTGANTFAILRITPFSGHGGLILYANQTVTGTLEITGLNQRTGRVLVQSDTLGTARTITCAGTVSITNADFRDITAAGGGAGWGTGTSVGNCFGNTGVTFTGAVTRYWVHPATASQTIQDNNWASSSGGATGSSFPLPQDTAVFDANSFGSAGKTVTIPTATEWIARMGLIQWSGILNSPTLTFDNVLEVYGDFVLATGVTISGTAAISFFQRSAFNIGTNGNTLTAPVTMNAIGGTLTMTSSFISSNSFTHTAGSLLAVTFDFTCTAFASNNSNTRALNMGTGNTWTLSGTGTVWNLATVTGLTFTKGTATIKTTNSSASAKTFAGGGLTYYNIWIATGSTGTNDFTGSNTFNQFKSDIGRSLRFTAGTTTTASQWVLTGTLGNEITIGSITAAGHTLAYVEPTSGLASFNGIPRANLAKAVGLRVPNVPVGDYLIISRSTGSPANSFFVTNGTDNLNNVDWTFTAPPDGPGLSSLVGISN